MVLVDLYHHRVEAANMRLLTANLNVGHMHIERKKSGIPTFPERTTRLGSPHMALLKGTQLWCTVQIYLLRFKMVKGSVAVGWLPIVPGDMSKEGKHRYTTLKHVVWHESFLKLLVHLDQYSKTGYSYSCYNKIMHWLFPVISILLGDYEEQRTAEGDNVAIEAGQHMWAHGNNCTMVDEWAAGLQVGQGYGVQWRRVGRYAKYNRDGWAGMRSTIGDEWAGGKGAMETSGPVCEAQWKTSGPGVWGIMEDEWARGKGAMDMSGPTSGPVVLGAMETSGPVCEAQWKTSGPVVPGAMETSGPVCEAQWRTNEPEERCGTEVKVRWMIQMSWASGVREVKARWMIQMSRMSAA
ncbi:hypothetical protein BDR06DRAFT_977432 [Suillus hirtellus]|nr:hypothetical protein BDR06DRAFT_977432 [Suillus hirtellus]